VIAGEQDLGYSDAAPEWWLRIDRILQESLIVMTLFRQRLRVSKNSWDKTDHCFHHDKRSYLTTIEHEISDREMMDSESLLRAIEISHTSVDSLISSTSEDDLL